LLLRLNLPFHYYAFVCILPGKVVPEMTCTVSGGTLNHTHSLIILLLHMCEILITALLIMMLSISEISEIGAEPEQKVEESLW